MALHAVPSPSANPESIRDGEAELNTEDYLIEATLCPEPGSTDFSAQEEHQDSSSNGEGEETESTDPREGDRLWKHLRVNLEKIRAFCADMVTQIPIPERCIIEGTQLDHSDLLQASAQGYLMSHTRTVTGFHELSRVPAF